MTPVLDLFRTEISLLALSLGCLVIDIFIPHDQKRGRTLSTIAMIGLSLVFLQHTRTWGLFGSALGGSFTQDGVSYFFKTIFLLAAFLTLFMAREYQDRFKRGHGEFVLLVLFALTGMTFMASASDFLLFFVALETLTISSYIMASYLRDQSVSIEAGVKYLVLGALSTAVFLYGLSFLYGATGSTAYAGIRSGTEASGGLPTTYLFGTILIVSSLAFKIAAVPFHLWAPDIYEGAPTPVTAFLSFGSKAAGFAAFFRLMATAFAPAAAPLSVLLGILAALSILYGNIGAIPQTNLKRLLGYSSIGHAGYMLIGLTAFGQSGGEAVLVYLLSYLVSAGAVFLVAIITMQHAKTEEISELAGLSKRSPLLAATMLLGLLSLAGVPPLAGFFAKFYVLWAGVKSGALWLVVIGVLNVITSLYYYLKIVKVMYVDEPKHASATITLTFDQRMMHFALIGGILAIGVCQGPFVRFAEQAFQHFLV